MKKSSKGKVKKTQRKPAKKIAKKPLKKILKKPLKKIAKKPPQKLSKKPVKKPVKKPAAKPSRKPSKKVSIKPVTITMASIKSTKTPLWVPPPDKIKNANITRFIEFVTRKHGKQFRTFDDLYQWSVDSIPDFWAAIWEFTEVRASKKWDRVVDDLKKFGIAALMAPGHPRTWCDRTGRTRHFHRLDACDETFGASPYI